MLIRHVALYSFIMPLFLYFFHSQWSLFRLFKVLPDGIVRVFDEKKRLQCNSNKLLPDRRISSNLKKIKILNVSQLKEKKDKTIYFEIF